MAKQVKRKNIRAAKKVIASSPFNIYWNKKNYIFLFLGFVLLFAGYYFMSINPWNSFPALNISPVILIIAYVVIFPASILFKGKKDDQKTGAGEEEANKAADKK
jgi:mannose/fructose/N-acetylgalactosamine-specific phosphotransferase system component IIC